MTRGFPDLLAKAISFGAVSLRDLLTELLLKIEPITEARGIAKRPEFVLVQLFNYRSTSLCLIMCGRSDHSSFHLSFIAGVCLIKFGGVRNKAHADRCERKSAKSGS